METPVRLHASAIAYEGRGALILGASGSGKSSLALQLISMGATLVADDQTQLDLVDDCVVMRAPTRIAGLIEARGVGLLHADCVTARLHLIIDLDAVETQRLPNAHVYSVLGKRFPCLHKPDNAAWPFAILQYLKAGRKTPE